MPGAGFVRPAMGAAWWVLLVQMALAVLAKAPRWALTQCAAAYPGVEAKLSALVRALPPPHLLRRHHVEPPRDLPRTTGKGAAFTFDDAFELILGVNFTGDNKYARGCMSQATSPILRDDPRWHNRKSWGVGTVVKLRNEAKWKEHWYLLITHTDDDPSLPTHMAYGVWLWNAEQMDVIDPQGLHHKLMNEKEVVVSNSRYQVDLRTVETVDFTLLWPEILESVDEDSLVFSQFLDVETGKVHQVEPPVNEVAGDPDLNPFAGMMMALQLFATPAHGWVRSLRPLFF